MTDLQDKEFQDVVDFHGCYCLDIAMGFRVAQALVREMGDEMLDMKSVFAHVGASLCSVDAIQKVAGCTFGKRNVVMTEVGKPVYLLQNVKSGVSKRAYVHYWDEHDHTEMRAKRKLAKAPNASESDKAAFEALLDDNMAAILALPEQALFSMTDVKDYPVPPKSSKYKSEPCACCAEYTKAELLREGDDGTRVCGECR